MSYRIPHAPSSHGKGLFNPMIEPGPGNRQCNGWRKKEKKGGNFPKILSHFLQLLSTMVSLPCHLHALYSNLEKTVLLLWLLKYSKQGRIRV